MTTNTVENLALLQITVSAKLAYWDALRQLEKAITPDGEFSDRGNDEVIDLIDMLAAGAPIDDAAAVVESEHLDDVLALVKRFPL